MSSAKEILWPSPRTGSTVAELSERASIGPSCSYARSTYLLHSRALSPKSKPVTFCKPLPSILKKDLMRSISLPGAFFNSLICCCTTSFACLTSSRKLLTASLSALIDSFNSSKAFFLAAISPRPSTLPSVICLIFCSYSFIFSSLGSASCAAFTSCSCCS